MHTPNVRKIRKPYPRRHYTLKELLAQCTAKVRRSKQEREVGSRQTFWP
jgi:hypothetical protein